MKLPPLFNPSNDMALAANVRQYVPTRHIRQMEKDLRELAALWEEGPWGWSLATKQHYLRTGVPEEALPDDAWLAELRRLSSREFACRYHEELARAFPPSAVYRQGDGRRGAVVLPCRSRFLRTMDEALRLDLATGCGAGFIFKAPWSASGRGNFVTQVMDGEARRRIGSTLRRQGGIVAEPYYGDKMLDFAMEFRVRDAADGASAPVVDFLGYSIFEADRTGHYGGNYVARQEELRRRIPLPDSLLQSLIRYHRTRLARLAYRGPVGIDMMVVRQAAPVPCGGARHGDEDVVCVHPLVEINFRMTMGLLAILLCERGMTGDRLLTPDRPDGFVCAIRDGRLCILFNKES